MASQFASTLGSVQQFLDENKNPKAVVTEREANGQQIREFTIKSFTTQTLIRVTLWPEFDNVKIEKGALVSVDGAYTVNEVKGKTYHNISAVSLTVVPPVPKKAREVVNQQSSSKPIL